MLCTTKRILLVFALLLMTASLQAQASASSESDTSSKNISVPRYIASGVIGSVAGFGIGHGIQGRYWPKGAVFTAGESVGLGLVIHCLNNLPSSDNDGDDNDGDDWDWDDLKMRRLHAARSCGPINKNGHAGACFFGLSMFIGFKIWEIISVWNIGASGMTIAGPAVIDRQAPEPAVAFNIVPIVARSVVVPGLGFNYQY